MNKRRFRMASAAIALAAAATLPAAQAQTSKVSLYGLIDGSIGSAKAPGGAAIKSADSGKMSTSYFGLTGTEDLGGGLSAFFTIDSFMRADVGNSGRFNGDGFWARNAFVGLKSDTLGTIRAGRNTTPLFVATLLFNAFGDSFGFSPSIRAFFTSGTVSGDSGWSDSVQYFSPSFSGFSFGAIVAAGEGAGGRNMGFDATYRAGGFAGTYVYQRVEKDTSATVLVDNTRTSQLNLSYDFGAAKLFGQYGKVDNNTTKRDYDIVSVGVSVPVGFGKILAQYATISPSVGADRKTLTVGYDYFLSKRTDVYVAGMSDKLQGLSAGNAYSVGVRHRF